MPSVNSFVRAHSFEKRKAESDRIRVKYPDRIPVIVERGPNSDIPDIDKSKFLVPHDLTVGQMVYVIRRRIKLAPEKAIFIFINNVLPPTSALISSIYDQHGSEDGFLYIVYSGESTFGSNIGFDIHEYPSESYSPLKEFKERMILKFSFILQKIRILIGSGN